MEQKEDRTVELGSSPEEGANLVEYALLTMLVAVTALAAVQFLGTRMSSRFSEVTTPL